MEGRQGWFPWELSINSKILTNMKKKVLYLLVGVLGFIAMPTVNSSSQTMSVKDYTALAKLSYDIAKDINKDCKEKQAAGLINVCKNGECQPGNCISLRKKCSNNDGCA